MPKGIVSLYVAVIAVCALMLLILFIAKRLGIIKSIFDNKASAKGGRWAEYKKRESVLTPVERRLLPVLLQALGLSGRSKQIVIFPSVRFAELLEVDDPPDRSAKLSALNRITSKQADFVLCDAVTTEPLMVIELDDNSHSRSDRQSRDEFIDAACASAGLPILHIKAAGAYDAKLLAQKITEALQPQ